MAHILDELVGCLNDHKPNSVDGKLLVPTLIKVIKNFQEKLVETFSDLKKELASYTKVQDDKIEELQSEVSHLKKKMASLEDKIDDQEAYERREQVVISGSGVPEFKSGENCNVLVAEILKEKLKLNLGAVDISCSHRLGGKPASQKPDRRSIIVKFVRRDHKADVLRACKAVKPTNLFVNESLTPIRQNISFALRKAKKEFPLLISGTTSLEGKVYCWVKPPNPGAPGAKDTRVAINNSAEIKDFYRKTLGIPVETYLPRGI